MPSTGPLKPIHAPIKMPQELIAFRELNPEITDIDLDQGIWIIKNPWGDKTITLKIPATDSQSIAEISVLRLPTQFTAIWHKDTNDCEFIFGYVETDDEIIGRKFTFSFLNIDYKCEYTEPSKELQKIIKLSKVSFSLTEFAGRNLYSLQNTHNREKKKLVSFWIRDAKITEDQLAELCIHSNFYMRFYDRKSPFIIIHESIVENQLKPINRYVLGEFPNRIPAHKIDPHLLNLWASIKSPRSSAFQKFLHGFQILEYALYYFMDEKKFSELKKILLLSPIPSKETCEQIIDLLTAQESKKNDNGKNLKLEPVISAYTKMEYIWQTIKPRMEHFTNDVRFDGDFKLTALLKSEKFPESEKEITEFHSMLSARLSSIRNALAHAKHLQQDFSIHPTMENAQKLKPWVDLIESIAAQLIIVDYK